MIFWVHQDLGITTPYLNATCTKNALEHANATYIMHIHNINVFQRIWTRFNTYYHTLYIQFSSHATLLLQTPPWERHSRAQHVQTCCTSCNSTPATRFDTFRSVSPRFAAFRRDFPAAVFFVEMI
jgi:hypothetical protein